jgi:hypothetical protein
MIIEKCKYISKKTNKGNSNMHVAAGSEVDCPELIDLLLS